MFLLLYTLYLCTIYCFYYYIRYICVLFIVLDLTCDDDYLWLLMITNVLVFKQYWSEKGDVYILINVRENRKGNQEWTILKHWQL